MKINIRKGTLPIPIPQPVGGIMGLAKFSRDVIRSLVALKNRQDSVQVPRGGGGGSSSPLPLTLKKGTDVDDIQIIPGYVNLEMPTLGGTALNHATPPEITVTADVWVWLKCVGTFGSPDSYVVTVETTTTATAPTGTTITATGFISFRPLGSVDFTAGSPATYDITNVHSGGNFGVDSFGNINLWWKA